MRQIFNTCMHGIGALLICIGFLMYMGIASMYTGADVMRMAVCAIATFCTGMFLSWWRV